MLAKWPTIDPHFPVYPPRLAMITHWHPAKSRATPAIYKSTANDDAKSWRKMRKYEYENQWNASEPMGQQISLTHRKGCTARMRRHNSLVHYCIASVAAVHSSVRSSVLMATNSYQDCPVAVRPAKASDLIFLRPSVDSLSLVHCKKNSNFIFKTGKYVSIAKSIYSLRCGREENVEHLPDGR